jgi:hypothetical protein
VLLFTFGCHLEPYEEPGNVTRSHVEPDEEPGSNYGYLALIFNGVGIFYLHLLLKCTVNPYSMHEKTVLIGS